MITQILGIITLGLSLLYPLSIQPIQENIQPNITIDINSFNPNISETVAFSNQNFNGFLFNQYNSNQTSGAMTFRIQFLQPMSWSNIRFFLANWLGTPSSVMTQFPSSSELANPGRYGTDIISNSNSWRYVWDVPSPPDNIAPTLTLGQTTVYFNASDYPSGISQAQQQAIINSYASVQDNVAGAFWELSGNYTTLGSSTTQSVTYGVRAKDAAGNVSAYQNFTLIYDVVPPYIAGPSQVTYVIGTVTSLQQIIDQHYTITDDIGIFSIGTISSFNLNQVGTYFIDLRATDNANNTTIKSIQVNIIPPPDVTPPTITGPSTLTFELGTWTLIEQILNTYYIITDDRDDWDWELIGSINFQQAGTYSVSLRITDLAGNNATLPITITITAPVVIDTTPPSINGTSPISRELGIVNSNSQLLALFTYSDNVSLPATITTELIGNVNYSLVGSYSVSIRATDQAGNQTTRNIVFNITTVDTIPPVITGPLAITIEPNEFETLSDLIDFYYVFTDNTELIGYTTSGTISLDTEGVYNITITAVDIRQNEAIKNVRITIREPIDLGEYNPLTDLLSGIFGGALSMIFTIGTINVLGLRLLDAMGVIILGAVLLFVYKAIKGGS
jgi:hypothetical protein